MPVTIRPATPAELSEVGALTLGAYLTDGPITAEHPYAQRLLDAAPRARDAQLLVAVHPDGALLGTVTYVRPGTPFVEIGRTGEAEVRMLAVSAAARGAGVGEQLMQACVERARDDGLRAVVLATGIWMTAAHRLYERLGFERIPERDWSPRAGIELMAYRRALLPP